MIRRIQISNFRSLGKGIDLHLGPLTLLVGPNGAGKSNVVDALRFVADSLRLGLSGAINERNGIGAVRRWSAGHPYNLSIQLDVEFKVGTDLGKGVYRFELGGDRVNEYSVKHEAALVTTQTGSHRFEINAGHWQGPTDLRPNVNQQSLALPLLGGDERFQPLAEVLEGIEVYSVFPDVLRRPQSFDPTRPMNRHGTNWTSILKEQDEDSWKPELIEALTQLTGDIVDIRIQRAATYLVAEFRHDTPLPIPRGKRAGKPEGKQKWFGAAQESDGTLRVAGILTALLQQPALSLIGIEEPELTVHPGAIPLLADYLRQASRQSQVVVTTHSPELLDQFEDADDIRVVAREAGATIVRPMNETQRQAVKGRLLTLGELQRLEGLQPQLTLALSA